MWTDAGNAALQDCFECTDWQMFRDVATQDNNISLEEYTFLQTYVSKCFDDVEIIKTMKM